jgi:hypothetical protein
LPYEVATTSRTAAMLHSHHALVKYSLFTLAI